MRWALLPLLLAGFACTDPAAGEPPVVEDGVVNATRMAAMRVGMTASKHFVLEGVAPSSMSELKSSEADEWGRALRIDQRSESSIDVRSAGADGIFDTEDDVVLPQDLNKFRPSVAGAEGQEPTE